MLGENNECTPFWPLVGLGTYEGNGCSLAGFLRHALPDGALKRTSSNCGSVQARGLRIF
jgi:hypothetical protein